jgi:cytochrome b561
MLFSKVTRYSAPAIALHWLIAALIVAGFVLGLSMVDLPLSPKKLKWFSWHKWIGVTVFLLTALRLLWRLSHPPPVLPAGMPSWQRRAATASHALLYILTIAIPLSGWIYSSASGVKVVYLGIVPLPDLVTADKPLAEQLKLVHKTLNFMLLGVVIVHVVAALKHHFVDRDDVLRRMLPWRNYMTERVDL